MDNYNMYYKIPKYLFDNDKYKTLSINAKVLYSIMLSKLAESVNNKQFDNSGYYIHFKVVSIMEMLNCAKNTALKAKKELYEYGLMTEKIKFNEQNRIYVNQIM